MRRSTLAGLAILALAAALAAWLLRADPSDEARLPPPPPAATGGEASPSFELALDADTPATKPLVEAPAPATAPASTAADVVPDVVRVIVVDPAAIPVAGATVAAVPDPYREKGEGLPPLGTWTTGEDGRCTLPAEMSEAWLTAQHPEIGAAAAAPLSSLRQAATRQGEIVLRLLRPSRLRGVVLEPDDTPAPGATVNFWAFGGPQVGVPADAITGPDGRFDVETAGGTMLSARAELGPRLGEEFRYVAEAGGEQEIVLRLPGDWSVDGIVFDRDGAPVADAKVTLWRNMPDHALPPEERPDTLQNSWWDETRSDASGRFHFAVLQRLPYTAIARVGLELPSSAGVAVIDATHDHAWLELRAPEPSFLSGQVVRADGSPAPDVQLVTRTSDWFSPYERLFAPLTVDLYGADGAARTDGDGRFRIEPLHPDGTYTLHIASGPAGHAPPVKGVRAGRSDVHIQLLAGKKLASSLIFDIVSARDGAPVAGAEMQFAQAMDGGFLQAQVKSETLPDGRRRVTGFSPGLTYSGWVVGPEHAALDLPEWIAEGGEQERRVELPLPAFLDLQLDLPEGRPAAWADVRLFPVTLRLSMRGSVRRAADAEGRVSFGPCDPGAMRLHVLAGGLELTRDITLAGGARETLRIALP